eukprot:1155540-Alexandrium_andersonii.AAC.1
MCIRDRRKPAAIRSGRVELRNCRRSRARAPAAHTGLTGLLICGFTSGGDVPGLGGVPPLPHLDSRKPAAICPGRVEVRSCRQSGARAPQGSRKPAAIRP